MNVQRNSKTTPSRRRKPRVFKWILVLLVTAVVLLFFFVPIYISSDDGRKFILEKINSTINGTVNFAKLSMGWFKGLELTDFSFIDKKGSLSVTAKRISTKPHYFSILAGPVALGSTIIDEPVININVKEAAAPESVRSAVAQQKPAKEKIGLGIEKVDLVVTNGQVNIEMESKDANKRTVQLRQINTTVNLREPGKTSRFDANLVVVENQTKSKVRTSGKVKPGSKGWSPEGVCGEFLIEVNDLDLSTLVPLFALAGSEVQAQGKLSADIKTSIEDGTLRQLQAEMTASNVEVAAPALKGDRFATKKLAAEIDLQADKEMVNIDNLDVKTDWLKVTATGTVPKTVRSVAEFVKLDSPHSLEATFECNLAEAMSQMPRTFGLRETANVTAGSLTGSVNTSSKKGQRIITAEVTLWALEGTFPIKSVILSKPIKFDTKIISDKTGVNIDKLSINSAFGSVNCSGQIDSLNYSAELDLAKMQSEFGQFINIENQLAGQVSANGTAAISKSVFGTTGSSDIKELKLTSPKGVTAFEPSANITYDITLDIKQNILDIDSLNLTAGFGRVGISDSVIPLTKDSKKALNLSLSTAVDLQKIQLFAQLFTTFPENLRLAGQLESSRFNLAGEQQYLRILTDSTTIRKLKLFQPGQRPFEQDQVSLACDILVDPTQKTIYKALKSINSFQLISPQIKITKTTMSQTTKAETTTLRAQIEAEYDLAEAGRLATKFLPEPLTMKGRRKHTIKLESQYPAGQTDKILANMTAQAQFGFDSAEFMGLNLGPTQTDIRVKNGQLSIAPFSTTINNGKFNFAPATADFRQDKTLLKTVEPMQLMQDIQINDKVTENLLKYVNPIFAKAVNVSGILNLHCEKLAIPLAGATKNDLEVKGTLSMSNVRLAASDLVSQIISVFGTRMHEANITIRPTSFVLQNGLLSYENMQVDIGDKPVNFKGVIGLDKTLHMDVMLPYRLEGRPARVGETTEGRVTLPLKGSVDKPELDVRKLLEKQLEQQLKQQLFKGLEKLLE